MQKEKKDNDNETLRKAQVNMIEILRNKVDSGCDKAKLFAFVEKLTGSKNPSNVKDIEVLINAIETVKSITPEELGK